MYYTLTISSVEWRRAFFTLLTTLPLLAASCSKKKDANPQLPAETTTGAMTFGCKVDGRIFTPRDGGGQPGLYVQYVNLGSGPGGGYYLNIPATDWKKRPTEVVQLRTDSLLLEEGKTYSFKQGKGCAQARYTAGVRYDKLQQDEGELTITRFDATQGILAGRFHFIGTDQLTGQQVHITEGRFDIRF